MQGKIGGPWSASGKWTFFLSFLFPVVLLSGLAVTFLPQSQDSDGCCGPTNTTEYSCGQSVRVDRTTSLKMWPYSITSEETDMRCGYAATWSYTWHFDKSGAQPPVTIYISTGKGSKVGINSRDTFGGSKWYGNNLVERSSTSWEKTKPVKITLEAVLGATDVRHLADWADISMSLSYCKIKRD
ncbi:MAG: hypothetical protein NTV42_07930 [Chloroflexi bacterium]|nr:hypothetical protein [Chloroflexota bacterium]